MAAGCLIITEAGGLVGNFTGESKFLHESEIVAGKPKMYGQLVQMLSPHTKTSHARCGPPRDGGVKPLQR